MKREKKNDLKGQALPRVKKALRVWNNYHSRVRNDINYSTVTICDEWYLFSNFYYWYIDNVVDNWHLDKDIR